MGLLRAPTYPQQCTRDGASWQAMPRLALLHLILFIKRWLWQKMTCACYLRYLPSWFDAHEEPDEERTSNPFARYDRELSFT
jgi:hypothetical protein